MVLHTFPYPVYQSWAGWPKSVQAQFLMAVWNVQINLIFARFWVTVLKNCTENGLLPAVNCSSGIASIDVDFRQCVIQGLLMGCRWCILTLSMCTSYGKDICPYAYKICTSLYVTNSPIGLCNSNMAGWGNGVLRCGSYTFTGAGLLSIWLHLHTYNFWNFKSIFAQNVSLEYARCCHSRGLCPRSVRHSWAENVVFYIASLIHAQHFQMQSKWSWMDSRWTYVHLPFLVGQL